MKLLLIFFIAFCGVTETTLAQQKEVDILQLTKQLIHSVGDGMKQQNTEFPEAVAESTNQLRKIPEFVDLENNVKVNWKVGVANLSFVAPTDIDKVIYLRSCQNLEPDSYLDLLAKLALLCEKNTIDKSLLKLAIYSDGKSSHLLEDNFANKRVIVFCNRAKKIWLGDSSMIHAFDAILSGDVKRSLDDMREAGADNTTEVKLIR